MSGLPRLLLALFFAAGVALPQQTAPGPPLIKSETHAVQIHVAVRDAQGEPVRGLHREDFVVRDAGKIRDVRIFSADNEPAAAPPPRPPLPPGTFSNRFGPSDESGRFTAIVIEAVLSGVYQPAAGMARQSEARAQAIRAIAKLHTGDAVAVYAICPELRIIQDYTHDLDRVAAALTAFQPCPATAAMAGGDHGLSAILTALRAVASHMSAASGRKSAVWISGGFPPPSSVERFVPGIQALFDSTVRAFNDADTALYPVYLGGMLAGMDASAQTMKGFAQKTGGHAYTMRNDLDQAIVEAIEDAAATYEVGFYLSDSDFDGKFHPLTVSVAGRPRLTLRYRRGYTASRVPAPPDGRKTDLDAALLSPLDSTAIRIDCQVQTIATREGKSLQMSLGLDQDTLSSGADHHANLDEVFVLTDSKGGQLAKISETVRFEWPGNRAARYKRTIPLPPGAVMLRIIVRDKTGGHVGSLKFPVPPSGSVQVDLQPTGIR
jgi:VWFA-related protein